MTVSITILSINTNHLIEDANACCEMDRQIEIFYDLQKQNVLFFKKRKYKIYLVYV